MTTGNAPVKRCVLKTGNSVRRMSSARSSVEVAGQSRSHVRKFDAIQSELQEPLDLLVEKILEDEAHLGIAFPWVTDEHGRWRTMPASRSAGYVGQEWSHGNWFCGFWVGLLLAGYLHTGNPRLREIAEERMRLIAPRADDPNTHDIGFIFNSSAIPAAFIIGDQWYFELALKAAERLRRRVVATRSGAYLCSWGAVSDPRGRRSSAIDTMANLPLLYWAADASGDESFRLAAEAHARATEVAFVRPDMSTCHAVEFDPASGQRIRAYTFQGHSDESAWSRGQGWAILGYAATAAATRDIRYLALAEQLADYFLRRLGDDCAPYWDFDDEAIPEAPRDSSAAAIVATALLDIADLHPKAAEGDARRHQAVSLLEGLCRDYLARSRSHRGLLMHSCYSRPHHEATDAATLFGDFYFVEAICKLRMPGRFRPVLEGLASSPSTADGNQG